MDILATLGLSADERDARRDTIGGSDANIIMSGDADRIVKLWRQKRGELPDDDLSDILAVQMGSFTEPLNAAWFEKQTGFEVSDRGEVCRHPEIAHMRCTLDGRVSDVFATIGIFEAKHCGTRSSDAEIFERYVPQLTHNCLCAEAHAAWLSVFKGSGDWMMLEYALDGDYAAALIEAEAAFWRCVQSGDPPAPLPPPPAPKPVGVKEYDLTGSNAWAAHAADYIATLLPHGRHEAAKKALKELAPDDASKCFGHGVTITRTKAGALRFAAQEA